MYNIWNYTRKMVDTMTLKEKWKTVKDTVLFRMPGKTNGWFVLSSWGLLIVSVFCLMTVTDVHGKYMIGPDERLLVSVLGLYMGMANLHWIGREKEINP